MTKIDYRRTAVYALIALGIGGALVAGPGERAVADTPERGDTIRLDPRTGDVIDDSIGPDGPRDTDRADRGSGPDADAQAVRCPDGTLRMGESDTARADAGKALCDRPAP